MIKETDGDYFEEMRSLEQAELIRISDKTPDLSLDSRPKKVYTGHIVNLSAPGAAKSMSMNLQ